MEETMLVPRQEYSRELKIAAMREIDSGKGMAEVARMYQLSPKRLETWKGEWRAKGELAFPGKSARPQTKLDAERIAELERKIGQQTMEIDFLKKVLRRFRDQPQGVVGNGAARSTNKSGKRPKRGQP
jgi:transposase